MVAWIHGGPGLDHHLLEPLAHELGPSWAPHLTDLPGHGPAHRDLGLDATLRGVARALAQAGPDAIWVGHSLGAWLIRELLRRDASLCPSGVVWIAPPAGDQPMPRGALPRRVRSDLRRLRRDLHEQVGAETGQPPSAAFGAAVHTAQLRAPGAHPRLLHEVRRALARPTPRCRPGCPVLLVRGEADSVVDAHESREIAALTDGAQLASVPGAGHFPAATEDDGFARVIEGFLAEVAPR